MRATRKPYTVRAEQWHGERDSAEVRDHPNMHAFCGFGVLDVQPYDHGRYMLVLDWEEAVFVYPGQWVVNDDSNNNAGPEVLDPDDFHEIYTLEG